MNRRSLIAGFALAVVVLGVAGRATAAEKLAFGGYLEGDVFRMPVPPLVQVDIEAKGRATQLGRFTLITSSDSLRARSVAHRPLRVSERRLLAFMRIID